MSINGTRAEVQLVAAMWPAMAAVKTVLLLVIFASSTVAFFTGDNACAPGEGAALSLKNWTGVKDIVQVPLSDSGVSFSVEGILVDPSTNDTVLELYGGWFLGITCNSNKSSFVGGLLRVGQKGNDSTPVGIEPESSPLSFLPFDANYYGVPSDSVVALACLSSASEAVMGVTQVESQLKKCQLTGILASSSPEYPVLVDMTVVLSYNATSGQLTYTYGHYTINMIPPTPTITMSTSVPAPTLPPLLQPKDIPQVSSTETPVLQPVVTTSPQTAQVTVSDDGSQATYRPTLVNTTMLPPSKNPASLTSGGCKGMEYSTVLFAFVLLALRIMGL